MTQLAGQQLLQPALMVRDHQLPLQLPLAPGHSHVQDKIQPWGVMQYRNKLLDNRDVQFMAVPDN